MDELLPTIYEMVTDGLVTVQDVTVVKSVSKDARHKVPEPESPRRVVPRQQNWCGFIWASRTSAKTISVQSHRQKIAPDGFSGATVYRGILGYGAKRHTHKAGRFHLSHDLPIMISVVEKPEKINELVQVVSAMMLNGIIVTSDVELHQIVHEMPNTGAVISNEQSTR